MRRSQGVPPKVEKVSGGIPCGDLARGGVSRWASVDPPMLDGDTGASPARASVRSVNAARSWREERVDALLTAMSNLGMSMSRPAAGELIDERVQFVAAQMRVTPATAHRYLTDEAVTGLAQSLAFGFVEETPGADLFSAPRDVRIRCGSPAGSALRWPRPCESALPSARIYSTRVIRPHSSRTPWESSA